MLLLFLMSLFIIHPKKETDAAQDVLCTISSYFNEGKAITCIQHTVYVKLSKNYAEDEKINGVRSFYFWMKSY